MVLDALQNMQHVMEDILSSLRDGLQSDDPATVLNGLQQTLKFFHSKFNDIKV